MCNKMIKKLNKLDENIALNLCLYRKRYNLSQEELGKILGCSAQQIQKYEKGQNRISVARLWVFARLLGVPVTAFIEVDSKTKIPDKLWHLLQGLPQPKRQFAKKMVELLQVL